MTESLFSASWYRVASLKPRLRGHAQIHRHHYRGQLWYVLQDHASNRFHRFSQPAHYVIGLMDGKRTVHEIWEAAMTALGDDAPTQEETIRLLGQLHAADLMQCDIPPDSLELFRRHRRLRRMEWMRRLWSPLALRFPLFDPERFLEQTKDAVVPLFGWLGAVLWLAVVIPALVLAGAHWTDLTENLADRVLAPQNLVLLWFVYPVVKALHELGHSYAVKRWGGEVHELGIMLLVFMPVPYVDASASSAFREKRRRMVVGAAGILVELFLAAIALYVWLSVESGLVSAIAYNVMLIGGASTLFFNGNPLLRFDGYYIFADAIGVPNLGTRSTRYIGYLFQRYLFGVADAQCPANARGERTWFLVYGIASFVYRMFIMAVIVLFVASKFFAVGVVLAIWALTTQIGVPLAKIVSFVLTSPRLRRQRTRAVLTSGAGVAALAAALTLVPVPSWTVAEGVVWLPERAQVRAGTDGFVARLLTAPGSRVRPGDALVQLEDPFLDTRIEVLEAELRALEARYMAESAADRVRADVTREEMAAVRADLAHAREDVAALVVRSPAAGRFEVPRARDLPGRFVRQGQQVGFVLDLADPVARVVVGQEDIGLVRERVERVSVRLAERVPVVLPGHIRRAVPGGSEELPSAALGSGGGGGFAVDPRDGRGVKTLEKVFQLDVSLPADAGIARAGGRVYVRFEHGREPLAAQWYRAARQLFLRRFGV